MVSSKFTSTKPPTKDMGPRSKSPLPLPTVKQPSVIDIKNIKSSQEEIQPPASTWDEVCQYIVGQVADYCTLCDQAPQTVEHMKNNFPALFHRKKFAFYERDEVVESTLRCLKEFAKTQPDHKQEMAIVALMVVELGFTKNVYIHSATADRILGTALVLVQKSLGELGSDPFNFEMANILGIKLFQQNLIERLILSALDFDIFFSAERYEKKFKLINKKVAEGRRKIQVGESQTPSPTSPPTRRAKSASSTTSVASTPKTKPSQVSKGSSATTMTSEQDDIGLSTVETAYFEQQQATSAI